MDGPPKYTQNTLHLRRCGWMSREESARRDLFLGRGQWFITFFQTKPSPQRQEKSHPKSVWLLQPTTRLVDWMNSSLGKPFPKGDSLNSSPKNKEDGRTYSKAHNKRWWFCYRKCKKLNLFRGFITNMCTYLKWRNPHLYKAYVRESPTP